MMLKELILVGVGVPKTTPGFFGSLRGPTGLSLFMTTVYYSKTIQNSISKRERHMG